MKTILITGCSSGFGLTTARTFHARGWNVIATMRTPREDILRTGERVRTLAMDVRDAESVRRAALEAGPIDALVNNAGVGLMSVFEGTPMDTVRGLFETNTFGAMTVTQAFLPALRARRSGVIVNVSSSVTLRALPMLAVYSASKAALNAFTESLALELEPVGVRVHLVLPGRSPETPFGPNARAQLPRQGVTTPEPYAELARAVFERAANATGPVTRLVDVAEAVFRAVTDETSPLRIPAGDDAVAWAAGL